MDPTQDFVQFVLKHPAYFHIAKSKIFLLILDFLTKEERTVLSVYQKFEKIDSKDLDEILKALVSAGLAGKHYTGARTVYFANDDAKILLGKVKKSKKHMFS